jgi:hypothetical protein
MKLTSLAARVERLERKNTPGLILVWAREGESEDDAKARTLAELGIVDRAGLPMAQLDWEDGDS